MTSIAGDTFSDRHAAVLLKYPHAAQDKLAEVCVKKGLTSRQLQELKEKEKQEIIQLYLQCLTDQEIADKIGKGRSTITEIVGKFISEEIDKISLVPDSLHCRLHH